MLADNKWEYYFLLQQPQKGIQTHWILREKRDGAKQKPSRKHENGASG